MSLHTCFCSQAMHSWNRWGRLISFILPWSCRLLLVACRAAGLFGRGHPNNILHLVLQDAVSGVGGLIGATYFPEKYIPGCVDFCCNSHNIMHVLTVAAVYSMHRATVDDLLWISTGQCTDAGLLTARGPRVELWPKSRWTSLLPASNPTTCYPRLCLSKPCLRVRKELMIYLAGTVVRSAIRRHLRQLFAAPSCGSQSNYSLRHLVAAKATILGAPR